MDERLPNLSSERWFSRPVVGAVFDLLRDDAGGARVVGGAVRNALMGHARAGAIDFATALTPQSVLQRAERAHMRAIPTGLDHGTITLVVDSEPFEITTLREDVETDGRHAVVRFGSDWTADARRRDFTVNALSVDVAGTVHDPLGGYGDILAGAVRFIGDPDRRVAEDRLRVLRLFRIHAQYGRVPLANADLAAVTRARNDVRELSAERVGAEMRFLAVARGAQEALSTMQDIGLLPIVLGGIGYTGSFRRLVEFESAAGVDPAEPLRLAAISARIYEDVERVSARLRLTNSERDRMKLAVSAAGDLAAIPGRQAARRLLYQRGAQAFRDGVALGVAWSSARPDDPNWLRLHALPDRDPVPSFPLSGRDLRELGLPQGPMIGKLLADLEMWWMSADFTPDRSELRQRLQQMVAGAQ
jgi:poly(A) polymerase